MKSKLVSIKRIIENEIGERIDTRNRRRDLTYARAVYCKIGRDMGLSLSAVGSLINRDHATVMHNVNTILPFALEIDYYSRLYQTLYALVEKNDEKNNKSRKHKYNVIKALTEKVEELQKDNVALNYKLMLLEKDKSPFDKMLDGLSKEEIDEVLEKLGIMVRAIKSRVYI